LFHWLLARRYQSGLVTPVASPAQLVPSSDKSCRGEEGGSELLATHNFFEVLPNGCTLGASEMSLRGEWENLKLCQIQI